jgi:hypothetical protein
MGKNRKGILAIKSLRIRASILLFICLPIFLPILRNIDIEAIIRFKIQSEIASLIPFLVYAVFLFFAIAWTLGVPG